MAIEARCIGCGECRRVCPHAATAPGSGPLPPRLGVCELCGACCEACPTEARRRVGEEMTATQVMEAVLKDRVFFEESGGGVTFSGGEPLMQAEFLTDLLSACRSEHLHTAVDTCGMVAREDLLGLAGLVDLFLYDLKIMEDLPHQRYTGVSNQRILQNLEALAAVHSNIWVRVPLIPGVNENGASLESAARFAAKLAGVRQVNVLPFHATGVKKLERLGQASAGASFRPPTREAVAGAIRVFEEAGLRARTGG